MLEPLYLSIPKGKLSRSNTFMQSSVPFRTVRITYKSAPVAIRELIYLPEAQSQEMYLKLREALGIEEALVFSTCNRTEVYYISETNQDQAVIRLLCGLLGIADATPYLPYFECLGHECQAVLKLFEVSMGLESAVLGDLQISNQIKQAYLASNTAGMAQAYFHRLLHTIFHTHKRVHQETPFRDGAASVSYASAELAHELTSHLTAPRALVIGLGEMGQDVARSLDPTHFGQIVLCNRTQAKADQLASELGYESLALADMPEQLGNFDVILSCVTVEKPLIHPDMLQASRLTGTCLIDLCVPRSVSPEVERLPHVLLYTVDDIFAQTQKTLAKRQAAIPQVQAIIHEEMTQFLTWRQQLSISPAIQQLKSALEDIRQEEIARFLKRANDTEAELIENVTKSLIQKIIKFPVLQLKEACKRGEQDDLAEVLLDVFDIERSRTTKAK